MAKQSFNWKSMFINEENATPENTPTPTPAPENKFPNQPVTYATGTSNPYLDEIYAVYDKGLESLNHSGFDFFELYRSVMAVGPNNPQSYQMAFAMGKTLNTELSKAFLLEKAQYYISEIEKVYAKYDATGNAKRKELSDGINKEKDTLNKEIQDLESKIAALQKELELKRMYLQKVDPGNVAQFSEIQLKIEANNLAKHKILDSINTVVTGINQYLQ
jgi:chaperonin cofactor prefoldin